MQFFKDIKNIAILTLAVLFIIKIPQENVRFIFWVFAGVLSAVIIDYLIHYFIHHKLIIPKSAVISGFIVAGILSFHEPFWLVLIFSPLAVISKHLIKVKKKHFLNPANTALFIATIFNLPLIWSLESNIYILIIAGIYFTYLLKKWGHVLGFLIPFSVLMLFKGLNPLLLISWFFVFIMLIEPKTSGIGWIRGSCFGLIAGLGSFLTYTFFPQYDFFITGLFIANLCNPVLALIFK